MRLHLLGGAERKFMTAKTVNYTKGEIGKVKVVRDFLPSPNAAEAALSDEALFDRAVAEGDGGAAVPHDVMVRLVGGENPLKVYREWRGLTQAELATQIGVTEGYVSQVERGARTLSRKAVSTAAVALGITPDDLD